MTDRSVSCCGFSSTRCATLTNGAESSQQGATARRPARLPRRGVAGELRVTHHFRHFDSIPLVPALTTDPLRLAVPGVFAPCPKGGGVAPADDGEPFAVRSRVALEVHESRRLAGRCLELLVHRDVVRP